MLHAGGLAVLFPKFVTYQLEHPVNLVDSYSLNTLTYSFSIKTVRESASLVQ